jgi:hypothetical protein
MAPSTPVNPLAAEREYWPHLRDVVRLTDGHHVGKDCWTIVSVGFWPNPLLILRLVTSARQRRFHMARLANVLFDGEQLPCTTSPKERT